MSYDEPEILPSQLTAICLKGADGGQQFLSGTASYTATLLALALLEGNVGERELDALISGFQTRAETILEAYGALPASLTGVRFLSCGPNLAGGAYGAAKLVELYRVPGHFCDIEEFAHSQFWASDPRDLVVYLVANAVAAEVATDSAAALGEMGFTTLAISTERFAVPTASINVAVPAVDEALSPLAIALPLQLLAWKIAVSTGYDPDTREHLKGDAVRFATSRRLTRKSLIGTGH